MSKLGELSQEYHTTQWFQICMENEFKKYIGKMGGAFSQSMTKRDREVDSVTDLALFRIINEYLH